MKKHVMIGAHRPTVKRKRKKSDIYAAASDFNKAFDAWTRTRGRTHLVYGTAKFAHP